MTKNTTGGKKHRSAKKGATTVPNAARKLELKQQGQEYAFVLKLLGNKRVTVLNSDNKEILCKIPGSFKREKVWIEAGDLVLISVRDFQDDKSDVIYKYNHTEIKKLSNMNELSKYILEKFDMNNEDDDIVFEDNSDSSSDNEEGIMENKNNKSDEIKWGKDEIDIDDL